jgi:hypothetical protein
MNVTSTRNGQMIGELHVLVRELVFASVSPLYCGTLSHVPSHENAIEDDSVGLPRTGSSPSYAENGMATSFLHSATEEREPSRWWGKQVLDLLLTSYFLLWVDDGIYKHPTRFLVALISNLRTT